MKPPETDDELLGKVLLQMERDGKIAIDPDGTVRLLSPDTIERNEEARS